MNNILMLDTSVGSQNKGDEIIMECVRNELEFLLKDNFEYTLPTHVSPFHWYQVWRNSSRVKSYANCDLKFVGGTNILAKNMLTHYPQWNINLFNCAPLIGCVLVGVGAGAGDESNWYTRKLYRKVLNHDFYHSCRDERTRLYLEDVLGLKAINTGCVTMWMLTPEFCKQIPKAKSKRVVFTLTFGGFDERDQTLIDTLISCYDEIYFWPQGMYDYDYLHKYQNIKDIKIIQSTKNAYDEFLTQNETDYVGTRLHGGVYAMRHKRRSIIIAIDERAREINKTNFLNCLEKDNIYELKQFIMSDFETNIKMNYDNINQWKSQF
jgi:polysaccharide pyruvyl transferase WcaK-like protein